MKKIGKVGQRKREDPSRKIGMIGLVFGVLALSWLSTRDQANIAVLDPLVAVILFVGYEYLTPKPKKRLGGRPARKNRHPMWEDEFESRLNKKHYCC